jgi:glycosyltransferase involved in cell wall biosynthesis
MHDLFEETRKNKKAHFLYKKIEKIILNYSKSIFVTNGLFREYYKKKKYLNTYIIKSSIDYKEYQNKKSNNTYFFEDNTKLKIAYVGSIYYANENTIMKFIQTIKNDHSIEFKVASSNYRRYLDKYYLGYLSKEQVKTLLFSSDVLLLPLAFKTYYPEEIQIAFPVKILEYMASGKPILGIIPKNTYIEKLMIENNIGIVVNKLSINSIKSSIDHLKEKKIRDIYSNNCMAAITKFYSVTESKKIFKLLKNKK